MPASGYRSGLPIEANMVTQVAIVISHRDFRMNLLSREGRLDFDEHKESS